MLSSNLNSPIDLGADELALARHLTYELLGRLFLEGITAVTHPTLQIIPALAHIMTGPFDADEAAADHQTLFGFNVFPYESIFLDGSGLLGGAITDAILVSYREAGFAVDAGSTSADHIGHELELLAHLCGAEADALADNLPPVAARMRHLQRGFLQDHLLRWLVPFVLAVQGQKRPFYTALAALTLDFVHDHFQELSAHSAPLPLRLTPALPEPPPLLNNEKTGLKEIAGYLTTPPYSGLFLSRDDIARLGRTQNIPRGFGDRTQILTNLLRGAAQFDTLPALLDGMQAVIATWQKAFTSSADSMPILAPFITLWQKRISQTSQTLIQIEQQIKMDSKVDTAFDRKM